MANTTHNDVLIPNSWLSWTWKWLQWTKYGRTKSSN